MKNKIKKNFLHVLCTTFILTQGFSGLKVFAYPDLPTMADNWGFTNGNAQYVKTRYWRYGSIDWSNAVSHASEELHDSLAKISITVSDSNSYNDCRIRISSNYWQNVPWAGITYPPVNGVYAINLNSYTSEINREKIATHEIAHAFGLNDCEYTGYLMFNAQNGINTITDYEDKLFINRYGRF